MRQIDCLQCTIIIALGWASFAYSDLDTMTEEIVVTGSVVNRELLEATISVYAVDSSLIDASSARNIAELGKYLVSDSGSQTREDIFDSSRAIGTSSFNLRGLGQSSTLVLFNGRRQTLAPGISNDGSVFVDTNFYPIQSIERIEILKEGASSTYGSDAVAGVVNIITRSDFDGVEFSSTGTKSAIAGDIDSQVSLSWGENAERYNFFVTTSYEDTRGISWGERADYLNATTSTLGTSVLLLAPASVPAGQSFEGDYAAFENVPAENCASFENAIIVPQTSGARCGFNFGSYFDIQSDSETIRFLAEGVSDINDKVAISAEIGYVNQGIESNVPPSFPNLNFPFYLGSSPLNPFGVNVLLFGRPYGSGFSSGVAKSKIDRWRTSFTLNGDFQENYFDLGLTYSENRRQYSEPDINANRLNEALNGFGGADCDAALGSPGVGDCAYFDPFTLDSPTNRNLRPYLTSSADEDVKTSLLVLDAILNHDFGDRSKLAVGAQFRDESFSINRNTDSLVMFDQNGIEIANNLLFLAGGPNFDNSQNASAIFTEFGQEFSTVSVRLGLRYDDLSSDENVSYKTSLVWNPVKSTYIRLNASSSFREASLSQISSISYAITGVLDPLNPGPPNAIRVGSKGSFDLVPEESDNIGVGVTIKLLDELTAAIDYWRVDYENVITIENPQDKLKRAYDPVTPDLEALADIRRLGGDPAGALQGLTVNFINAEEVQASGIDLDIKLQQNFGSSGFVDYRISLAHLLEYKIPRFGDVAGSSNFDNFARALPKTKFNAVGTWNKDSWNISAIYSYVSSYKNSFGSDIPEGFPRVIDNWDSIDLSLAYSFQSGPSELILSIAVNNLTDKDPPIAWNGDNPTLDAQQHDNLGRIISVGLKYSF